MQNEEKQKTSFIPITQVSVTPNGVMIGFTLAAGLAINVILAPDTMESLTNKWQEFTQQKKSTPKLIRDPRPIDRSKIDFDVS